jgi:hypothetical protein
MSVYAVSISFPSAPALTLASGSEFDMAHEPAGSFQQTLGIGNLRATKESDVNVSFEGIDIAERRIGHTRRRMAVMQQLPNVRSTGAHDLKPFLRDHPQFARMLMHPDPDCRVPSDRAWESKKLAHGDFNSAAWLKAVKRMVQIRLQVCNLPSKSGTFAGGCQ